MMLFPEQPVSLAASLDPGADTAPDSPVLGAAVRRIYKPSSEVVYEASNMDPLSQAIALLSPQAVGWRVVEAHGAWTLRFPPSDVVVFGQMIEGACKVEREDGAVFELQTGDFMLMASPPPWSMGTRERGRVVDFKAVLADPNLLTGGGAAEVTRFIAGHFVFGSPSADLLASLMLPIVHIRGADMAKGRLGALLALLGDEALADRPGRSLVSDRLLEVLLVEALRQCPGNFAGPGRGLLAGLADRHIGCALRAMHGDTMRPWTVAALARHVGMSRSSFAARFAQVVGLPPIDYLASWRMTLAKAALTSSTTPMADIAEMAGYQSVSAFSTAFKRTTGRTPTAYTRSAAA